MRIKYCIFAVEYKPYCVWGWDLHEKNVEFIEGIDWQYFEYFAKTHVAQLDGENAQHAAIALRTVYHLGLETLFTLICAAIQAPDCVVGWVQKCTSGQLRRLIKIIDEGNSQLINKLGLEIITWETVSNAINVFGENDDEKIQQAKKAFARLWRLLGSDFVRDINIKEYNSLKHGFRAKAGGFSLTFGREKELGISPPPQEMETLCHSDFGTSFFSAEQVAGAPDIKSDPHFRVKSYATNWDPISTANALMLTSLSIRNIVSFLSVKNGKDPKEVMFYYPHDNKIFETPWNDSTGGSHCAMDLIVSEKNIKRFSREEMLDILKKSRPSN